MSSPAALLLLKTVSGSSKPWSRPPAHPESEPPSATTTRGNPGGEKSPSRNRAAAEAAESWADLAREAARVPADVLLRAVEREARHRFARFLDGVERYRRHPYRRTLVDAPVVWSDGTTMVRDFAPGSAGLPVLYIPSLINRAYILDLGPATSLLRHLAAVGFRPLLVDWDAPGPVERQFDLTAYIAGRLEGALDAVLAATGRRPAVVGYCMGGLLALALALRRRRDILGLGLLATPWDFKAGDGATFPADAEAVVAAAIRHTGVLPVEAIQTLFAMLDPIQILHKFEGFGAMTRSDRIDAFVALEDWLNDGVPLAGPVAEECLFGWYGDNTPARGAWRVGGDIVDPAALDLPVQALIPARDRIVPPESAQALADALARGPARLDLRFPPLGHIGMVVGGRAPDLAWGPHIAWLGALDAMP